MNWIEKVESNISFMYDNYERLNFQEASFHRISTAEGKTIHKYDMTLSGCSFSDLNLDSFSFPSKLLRVSRLNHFPGPSTFLYGWANGIVRFDVDFDDKKKSGHFGGVPAPTPPVGANGLRTKWVRARTATRNTNHKNEREEYEIGKVYLSISSTDEIELEIIVQHFRKWEFFGEEDNDGKIYTLTASHGGLQYSSIGVAKTSLIEDNYDDSIIDDIQFAIDDLNSMSPSGRVLILNGPPGTGKTYLIRSILNEVPEATFLIVPASIVNDITGPQLMSFFIENSSTMLAPIVLVIEDADSCLVGRNVENMTLISNLLNISDGIIGNLLDIRILATTNAERLEIDEAILRPGRLSRHITIDKLSSSQAERVYKRLTGNDISFDNEMTLAEIYELSKNSKSSTSTKKNKPKVGFNI